MDSLLSTQSSLLDSVYNIGQMAIKPETMWHLRHFCDCAYIGLGRPSREHLIALASREVGQWFSRQVQDERIQRLEKAVKRQQEQMRHMWKETKTILEENRIRQEERQEEFKNQILEALRDRSHRNHRPSVVNSPVEIELSSGMRRLLAEEQLSHEHRHSISHEEVMLHEGRIALDYDPESNEEGKQESKHEDAEVLRIEISKSDEPIILGLELPSKPKHIDLLLRDEEDRASELMDVPVVVIEPSALRSEERPNRRRGRKNQHFASRGVVVPEAELFAPGVEEGLGPKPSVDAVADE